MARIKFNGSEEGLGLPSRIHKEIQKVSEIKNNTWRGAGAVAGDYCGSVDTKARAVT